jgi:hypothetical protein
MTLPAKQLEQYTICLMSFTGAGIFSTTGLSYALTVMVDHFIIFYMQ